nr:MAG TPA: hypothetical protein [Caudoviricetes sp.]
MAVFRGTVRQHLNPAAEYLRRRNRDCCSRNADFCYRNNDK